MTTSIDAAVEDALAVIDDDLAPADRPPPYVGALQVCDLFADPAYQRDLDELRTQQMVDDFDPTLLGVLEVSDRGDGRYAILDGQHRWAAAREVLGDAAHMVCQIHRGLSVTDEARTFYEIDVRRRSLSGWDRWKARGSSGDEKVLAIEACVTGHDLKVAPSTIDGHVRATKAMEDVVDLSDIDLLDQVLGILKAAYGVAADGYDGAMIYGLALAIDAYSADELNLAKLVEQLQGIAPRQIKARAALLREAHKGTQPRLCAAVIIDRYNAGKGRSVEDYLVRVPAGTKSNKISGADARRSAAIRRWAQREGLRLGKNGHIPIAVRRAYEAAHPAGIDA